MDDATRQLLAKSQQYLRSAAVLLETGDYDSCVSRVYFAMFYAAQAALLAAGASVRSRRSVRSAFIERFVDSGRFPRRAGQALEQAHQLQETADYAQRPAVAEQDAEQALGQGEAFIGSIDTLVRREHADRQERARAARDRRQRLEDEDQEREQRAAEAEAEREAGDGAEDQPNGDAAEAPAEERTGDRREPADASQDEGERSPSS